jgi:hypothetical protein
LSPLYGTIERVRKMTTGNTYKKRLTHYLNPYRFRDILNVAIKISRETRKTGFPDLRHRLCSFTVMHATEVEKWNY